MTSRLRNRNRGGSGSGGTPAFTPADIPDLGLWLDASDASTITHISNSVSQWNDKTVNGRNFTQGSGTLQPTLVTNGISFDGSNDIMSTTQFMYDAGAVTLFFIADIPSQSNKRYLFCEGNTGAGSQNSSSYMLLRQGSGFGDVTFNQAELWNSSGSLRLSTKFGDTVVFTGAGGTNSAYMVTDSGTLASQWKNGTPSASTQAYTRSGAVNLNYLSLGGFRNGGDVASAVMTVREVLVYTRVLTTDEKNQIGNYGASKWSYTWTTIV